MGETGGQKKEMIEKDNEREERAFPLLILQFHHWP